MSDPRRYRWDPQTETLVEVPYPRPRYSTLVEGVLAGMEVAAELERRLGFQHQVAQAQTGPNTGVYL